jgi:hypothetical protein
MKTEIWVNFNYGAWHLSFSKTFIFPFTPFVGMFLLDKEGDYENQIELANNDYRRTMIFYYVKEDKFIVDINEHWKRPVSDECIDNTIEIFKNTKWKREDDTNVSELKELMKRDYEKTKKTVS